MKRKILSTALATICMIMIAFSLTSFPALAANTTITEEKAKSIALKDADFTEKEVIFISVTLDKDETPEEYEVEFCHGTVAYSYKINAKTGKIISSETDDEYYINPGCVTVTTTP